MKKLIVTSLSIIMSSTCIIFAQEREITQTETPTEIRSFINTHFPNAKITKVTEEKTSLGKEYDVLLDNKIELEFDHNNELIDIESKSKVEIPKSIIPKSVWDYSKANYLKQQIIGWEKENNVQRVDLSNGLVIEFNHNGTFIKTKK